MHCASVPELLKQQVALAGCPDPTDVLTSIGVRGPLLLLFSLRFSGVNFPLPDPHSCSHPTELAMLPLHCWGHYQIQDYHCI